MKLQRRPRALKILRFEAWFSFSTFNWLLWWFPRWLDTEICQFWPTAIVSVEVNIYIYCYRADIRIYLWLYNELDRKINVTAMQFLLVQNKHQTHEWTLFGSGANGPRVTCNPDCKKTDKTNSIYSSLKSHCLWVTLYVFIYCIH